jgi:hypothetical protein
MLLLSYFSTANTVYMDAVLSFAAYQPLAGAAAEASLSCGQQLPVKSENNERT